MQDVSDKQLTEFITAALKEDIGPGDYTSMACIDPTSRSTARLLVKDEGVLAGVDLARAVFMHLDPNADIDVRIADGSRVTHGDEVFFLQANTRAILAGERLALNCMQRMCGIATMSRRYADEVKDLPVQILDTRKTTPLLRFLEKWAVRIGGATNYRYGLYDRFMLKDNHIDACGGVKNAIERIAAFKKARNLDIATTVEVRSLEELRNAMRVGGFERVMLDNMTLDQMREAVQQVDGAFEVEASGGITYNDLRSVAMTGVDFISSGALTHSYESLDLSLKILKDSGR